MPRSKPKSPPPQSRAAQKKARDNRAPEDIPRPGTTKLTPRTEALIISALGLGAAHVVVANAVGVSVDAIVDWLRRFPDFAEKVEAERGKRAISAHARIEEASAGGNWHAARYQLETLYPKEYSRGRGVSLNFPGAVEAGTTVPDSESAININLNMPFVPGAAIRNDPAALDAADAQLREFAARRNAIAGDPGAKLAGGVRRRMQRGGVDPG